MPATKDVKFKSKVFNSETANVISDPIFCADHKSIEFSLATDASAALSIRVIGSIQETPPDPSQAVSADNDYAYVVFQSESESASYNGASPLVISGAISKIYRFNTEGLTWAFLEVFNRSDGSVVVANVTLSDNQ